MKIGIFGIKWFIFCVGFIGPISSFSQITELNTPVGSGTFGSGVYVLTNGNIVVTDTGYDEGQIVDVGAVYLFHGGTKQLISKFTGSHKSDKIGLNISTLNNGNFVIHSELWDNDTITDAGAFTWVNGDTGLSGVLSDNNSMVGNMKSNFISGRSNVVELKNGNYVVWSLNWGPTNKIGWKENLGAVTFCLGNVPTIGVVSVTNSLVGGPYDPPYGPVGLNGLNGVVALENGNYVVSSSSWNFAAGAVTWGSKDTGVTGVVSSINSLVGVVSSSYVGRQVYKLKNGNYILTSQEWTDDKANPAKGSVMLCDGSKPIVGYMTGNNTFHGTRKADRVGQKVVILPDDNFLVFSTDWSNSTTTGVGAVTWFSGTIPTLGTIDSNNSLIGLQSGDIYNANVTLLKNGNYLISYPNYDNFSNYNAGAIGWYQNGNPPLGTLGGHTALIGKKTNDNVGQKVEVNSKGNYVWCSEHWDNGDSTDAGIVIWQNCNQGLKGYVKAEYGLAGKRKNDRVGSWIKYLPVSDNFVCASRVSFGKFNNVGSATWIHGDSGIVGYVDSNNSLIGSQSNDLVGAFIFPLANGNYIVINNLWNNGEIQQAGSVTWGNGFKGTRGVVSKQNSLYGSTAYDQIGSQSSGTPTVLSLANGNYVVGSSTWDYGNISDAGASTLLNGFKPYSGSINKENSIIGTSVGSRVSRPNSVEIGNSNYLVRSEKWTSLQGKRTGSITWGDGSGKTFGQVCEGNSLIGLNTGDSLAEMLEPVGHFTLLDSTNYLIRNDYFDNGNVVNAGFVLVGDSRKSILGKVSDCKVILGTFTNESKTMHYVQNKIYKYTIVSKPLSNKVFIIIPTTRRLGIVGNGNEIYDGSRLSNLRNGTDLGTFNKCPSSNNKRVYTIKNLGDKSIHFPKNTFISIESQGTSEYKISKQPNLDSLNYDSLIIEISFIPKTTGVSSALIKIPYENCGLDTFDFLITANVIASKISITGNEQTIKNNDTSTRATNNTDFGAVNTYIEKKFTIANSDLGTLFIDSIKIKSSNPSDFKVVEFPDSIIFSAEKSLTLSYHPKGHTGYQFADVEIYNNDCQDSVFRFRVSVNELLSDEQQKSPESLEIIVKPNPASEIVNISLSELIESPQLTIISFTGAIVSRQTITNSSCDVDISSIQEGMYFVIVENKIYRSVSKLLITKY